MPLLVQNVPVWLESLRGSLGEKNKTLLTGFGPGQVCFTSAFQIITALSSTSTSAFKKEKKTKKTNNFLYNHDRT